MTKLLPPLINSLLVACGPSAVARLVVAVVVDAIQGMRLRRFTPHIVKEVLEGAPRIRVPSVADRDPAPAIVRVTDVLRVVTALSHRKPCDILSCQRISSRVAVLDVLTMHLATCFTGPYFSRETAATATLPRTKGRRSDIALRAAFAAAVPENVSASSSPESIKNKPATETLASEIKLMEHLELILSGATGQGVGAPLPR